LLVALLLSTTVGSLAFAPIHVALAADATTTSELTLRAGAGTEFEALTVIPAGATLSVDGDPVNGFYPVSYTGIAGWAAAEFIVFGGGGETVPATGGGEVTKDVAAEIAAVGSATTNDSVNLRAGPSTEDAVLGELPAGTVVGLTGQQVNGFLEVVANGATGWVSADFLGTGGASAEAPAEAVPPAPEPAPDVAPPAESAPPPEPAGVSYSERQIIQIIHEAADKYDQPREDMVRVARCESNLDPYAVNSGANNHGLFQFVPDTFAGTPYGGYDIYDPWANANAAGWMWSEGRRGEWVC
jgi:uncharacterized protein YraI